MGHPSLSRAAPARCLLRVDPEPKEWISLGNCAVHVDSLMAVPVYVRLVGRLDDGDVIF